MDFTYRPTSRLLSPAEIQDERDQAIAGKQRNALMALQLQGAQEERAAAQRNALLMQQFRDSIPSPEMGASQNALMGGGGPTVANAAKIQPVDPRLAFADKAFRAGAMAPGDYMNMRFPQAQPKTIKSDETLIEYMPGQAPRTVIQGAPKAEPPTSDWKDYQRAVSQGYTKPFIEYQREMANLKAPKTTIDLRQPGAFATAQGKEFSDLMGQINRESFAAPAQIRKLERMAQLLEGVDGGKLAPLGLEVASAANSLGIKIDPRLGNKEAAQALARELAGGMRQPGTGPMTDKDFDNFLMQVPDLSKTAEGRRQITQTMRNAANRNIKLGQLARQYVAKNGQLDNGFLEEAAQFIAENPVVGDIKGWRIER